MDAGGFGEGLLGEARSLRAAVSREAKSITDQTLTLRQAR